MGKIKIIHDKDGGYGYPIGTILSVEELFKDFRKSNDCDDSLYKFLQLWTSLRRSGEYRTNMSNY